MEPPNRQERFQMRQRGAATRKIDAVDFGLSFNPTPRRSARSTPQSSARGQRSQTPTINRRPNGRSSKPPSKEPDLRNFAASGSQASASSTQPQSGIYEVPEDGTGKRSQKRRKLSAGSANEQLRTPSQSQSSIASSIEPRSASVSKTSALTREVLGDSERAHSARAGNSHVDKENHDPDMTASKTPRSVPSNKKQGLQPLANSDRLLRSPNTKRHMSNDLSMFSATRDITSDEEILVAAVIEESADESFDDQEEGLSLMTARDDLPESTVELVAVFDDTTINPNQTVFENVVDPSLLEDNPQTPGLRSANIKKKRSSMKTPATLSAQRSGSVDPTKLSSEDSVDKEALALPNPPTVQFSTTPMVHPASDDSFYQQYQDDEDETYLQPTSPVVPTPKVIPKKPRRKPASKGGKPSSSTSYSKVPKRNDQSSGKFPIVVQRLTNTGALPTIAEESELDTTANDEADAETRTENPSLAAKFRGRPNPNAVDVLAQFCREDIEAALENLGTSGDTQATLKRKRASLTTYSTALHAHLATLSNALEYSASLEAQVRKSEREKLDMRVRWIEMRRERESLRVQIDDARVEKEEFERRRREEKSLNDILWKTEAEVQRGPGQDSQNGVAGLEYRIRTLAEGVSSKVGGGLLDHVKAMNETLEGMVGMLERRKNA